MVRSRILWKLYVGFVLVILLTAGTVYLVSASRIEERVVAQVQRELEHQAERLEAIVGPALAGEVPAPDLQARVRDIGKAANTRFTLILDGGKVVADSSEDPSKMDNHAQRREIAEARRTLQPATSSRRSGTVRDSLLYLAVPVVRDGRAVAFVRAALPLTELDERRSFLLSNVATGSALAAALALVIGLVFSRAFTRRLDRMTHVAQAIAAGDYGLQPPVGSGDEIGRLGEAIADMSNQLEQRMEDLSRERNELRAILASMLEGVVAVDREERVVQMNDIAGRFLGTTPAEATGRRIWEVTRLEDIGETVAAVLADASEQSREIRVTRDRQERDLAIHASPLKSDSEGTFGAVLVLHDVTELRRLETVRRDFVANVSHELKTPLTAIRGFVETLLDDEEMDPATRRRFLERSRDQAMRLGTLVSDLLVLSRVESESDALERKPIDLRNPVRDGIRRLTPDASGRRLEFRAEVPDQPVPVLGDTESLRQVADNLLDNAIKYTPDGGAVAIRLRTESGFAVLEVEDTGIGIETKDLGRIFERFYRVDKARSRELGGTGLGLSIVKHIVEAHAGRVTVASRPGRGTTFRVEIPLQR